MFDCHSVPLCLANIDREDVCDMSLDASSAAEFELAVDRQVLYDDRLD